MDPALVAVLGKEEEYWQVMDEISQKYQKVESTFFSVSIVNINPNLPYRWR